MGNIRLEFIGWAPDIPGVPENSDGKHILDFPLAEGKKLRDLFWELAVLYPHLIRDIYDLKTDKINSRLSLFSNGELLWPSKIPDHSVKDGDSLTFLVLLAGG